MKKIILLLLIVLICVFSFYLYSQAQRRKIKPRPEDMAGNKASSFAELPMKKSSREDTGDLKLTAPVWVEE